MSWLLVLFSKEQGKRVRTLGIRGGESETGAARRTDASHTSGPLPHCRVVGGRPGHPSMMSLQEAVQSRFQKAKQQSFNRYVIQLKVTLWKRITYMTSVD
jgi:hypothetical protein